MTCGRCSAMMLPMDTDNVFAREARAKKLACLLEAADAIATEGGLVPHIHAAGILDCWKNAKPAHFAALVARAKVNPPSSITFDAFFAALAERVQA